MTSLPKHSDSWNKLGPPLRPTLQVAKQIRELCQEGETLLLGVTPEFYPLFDNIIAVDSNPRMIETVWLGDTEYKRAVLSDWMTMTASPGQFVNIIGDGGLTLLGDLGKMFNFVYKCKQWLRPGGIFVHRVFERPIIPISMTEISHDLNMYSGSEWNAFKWKMVYYLAEKSNGPVPLAKVRDMFNEIAPDRKKISAITGWTMDQIDTIDFYENIETVTFIPNRQQWLGVCGDDVKFIETTGYNLAETCPLMVWKKQ
jgi:hypothetical protein